MSSAMDRLALGLRDRRRAGRPDRDARSILFAPRVPADADASPLRELGALAKGRVWLTLGIGAIGFGGMFCVYTYLASTLLEVTHASPAAPAVVLAVFGAGMTVGTLVCAWAADRALMPAIGGVLLWSAGALALYPMATGSLWTLIPVVFLIGCGGGPGRGAADPADGRGRRRPDPGGGLNHSAFNFANALGPWLGGLAIAAGWGWPRPAARRRGPGLGRLAMAAQAPIMQAVKKAADDGVAVVGICNGFQILCEAGMLPGALLRNAGLKYVCKPIALEVTNGQTRFTAGYQGQREVVMTQGNGDGNYFADAETLARLEGEGQVVFRYVDNPNGSVANIAGIQNARGNVLGMMPHPDRAFEAELGSADGATLFRSVMAAA
jgi:phosphoribosylformylglycinamidine synthase I